MSTLTPALAGAVNFRDVGGLPAATGTTRSGVLFRSGSLARIDEPARTQIAGIGLRRIVDLRDDDEVALEPTLGDLAVADTVRVPLVLGSVASFFENDMSLDELYAHIVDESAPRLVEVVRAVIETQPVLVHCTAGKDRTGVSVALILSAAGVEEDAVVADYARTAANLDPERARRIVSWLRRVHPDAVHLEELVTGSPEPAMRGLLERLRGSHGDPADYLRAAGVSDDELAELRRILIAPR
ncbi:tyrosine-protein phosphatase [Microbacterium sp. cx-55]|uniref:tyrosine-protein phosphatase n=1 Tax=Microbacterium sp. cx-55 TaxID=2875948 RepID=UPI001CBEFED9|nr:tyrosine-protein phosphatase [Microbacterium sp. cx-55]MBZ4488685.1 tyrosine-protein phosphatase [Microbacterium sp. cx-55]UGB36073.1 tyrosine-protein phosphatase [Microbacterium sp. cx-55]